MSGERGYAYLFLLIGIAIIAGASAHAVSGGAIAQRKEAEQDLLFIGQAFEVALFSYAAQGTRQQQRMTRSSLPPQGPTSLEELLLDSRFPEPVRHLRKLYVDPITGQRDWGLIRNDSGNIIGIYSRSTVEPIKRTGFPARHSHLEQAKTYQEWVFGLPEATVKAPFSAAEGRSRQR